MDTLTPERRSANMRRIRSEDTSPEWTVRRIIHAMGYRYRLHVPNLAGKPDMVFPRWKKIVEVRGCFWHQHAGCVDSHIPKSRQEYWRPKLARNQARDALNEETLRAQGWAVLIVWECETANVPSLEKRLRRFLKAK